MPASIDNANPIHENKSLSKRRIYPRIVPHAFGLVLSSSLDPLLATAMNRSAHLPDCSSEQYRLFRAVS